MSCITGWRVWHPRRGYRASGALDSTWSTRRGHLYASRGSALEAQARAQTRATAHSADQHVQDAVVIPAIVVDPTWEDLPEAIQLLGDHPLADALRQLVEHRETVAAAYLALPNLGGLG